MTIERFANFQHVPGIEKVTFICMAMPRKDMRNEHSSLSLLSELETLCKYKVDDKLFENLKACLLTQIPLAKGHGWQAFKEFSLTIGLTTKLY